MGNAKKSSRSPPPRRWKFFMVPTNHRPKKSRSLWCSDNKKWSPLKISAPPPGRKLWTLPYRGQTKFEQQPTWEGFANLSIRSKEARSIFLGIAQLWARKAAKLSGGAFFFRWFQRCPDVVWLLGKILVRGHIFFLLYRKGGTKNFERLLKGVKIVHYAIHVKASAP